MRKISVDVRARDEETENKCSSRDTRCEHYLLYMHPYQAWKKYIKTLECRACFPSCKSYDTGALYCQLELKTAANPGLCVDQQ